MREIKLRAWDTCDGVMKFFDFYDIHCGVYFPSHWKDSTGLACELDDKARYPNELMQYTGLKDKNGVEIFEGDVVRIWDYGFRDNDEDDDEYGLFRYMGLDVVSLDRFRYWLRNEKHGYEGEDLINPEHCEVIGNIYEGILPEYENPELLEGK